MGLVLCAMPFLGCASKSADKSIQSHSGTALSKSTTPAPFNNPKYQQLIDEIEASGGVAPVGGGSESTLTKIGTSVKKATGAVTTALMPKPKIIKAPDPVSLDSMPESINANVFYQAGRLAESKGKHAAAADQYAQALEVDAEHLPSIISLARLNDRNNKFSEAQQLYRKAIEVAPENAVAYNDLGLCLARSGRDEEALGALRHAVSLEPDSKLYRNNLATLLVDMKRASEAWNELLGAHSPAIAHYNVGYLLHENGDLEQAREQFQLAVQKDSSLLVAREMLAQLEAPAHAGSASSEKVRYRVEDMMADAGPSDARRPTRAQPVTMVSTPRKLRRIPSTDGLDEAPKPPTMQLREPIPVPPSSPSAPTGLQQRRLPPTDAMQFPTPANSSIMLNREDSDADLPTPALLNEVVQN
jgi:Flp pilus assembly protein TadD